MAANTTAEMKARENLKIGVAGEASENVPERAYRRGAYQILSRIQRLLDEEPMRSAGVTPGELLNISIDWASNRRYDPASRPGYVDDFAEYARDWFVRNKRDKLGGPPGSPTEDPEMPVAAKPKKTVGGRKKKAAST